jgi:RNase P subunit RPR2
MRKRTSDSVLKEIDRLFSEAIKNKDDKKKSIGSIKKARKFARRNNSLVPKIWRDKFCHKCDTVFNSKNKKVRISGGKISAECLNCHHVSRRKFK